LHVLVVIFKAITVILYQKYKICKNREINFRDCSMRKVSCLCTILEIISHIKPPSMSHESPY